MSDPRGVIIRPVVSEKSYGLLDQGVYTFVVAPGANKIEIRHAVEADLRRQRGQGQHAQPARASASATASNRHSANAPTPSGRS